MMQHFGSKADALAASLRQRIVSGDFPVGSYLPAESDILSEYRISRPTYREAIRVLEAEGLLVVERGAKGGTRVCQPGIGPISRLISLYLQVQGTTVNDLIRHRKLIEPPAIHDAICGADEEMLDQLDACVADQRALLDEIGMGCGPARGTKIFHHFVELDSRLRMILFSNSGNAIGGMVGLVVEEMMRSHRANYGPVLTSETSPELLKSLRESILARIEVARLAREGRAEDARAIWQVHLDQVESDVTAAGRGEVALLPIALQV